MLVSNWPLSVGCLSWDHLCVEYMAMATLHLEKYNHMGMTSLHEESASVRCEIVRQFKQ